ncbi:MAG: tetratricopeptide repeat-containing sensor histidine kinase [Reichenbachiella sp.]|uniref:tetratricopeptide repeat-containing sensor histidine kinase n=1 Tax=Reichenbachiella sp. TaxID=2184521 RepID=UPI00329958DA
MIILNKIQDLIKKPIWIIGFFIPYLVFSQDQKIADSLIFLYNNSIVDNRFEVLLDIAFNETNPSRKLKYSKQLFEIAQTDSEKYKALFLEGSAQRLSGTPQLALDLYIESAKIAQNLKDNVGLGESLTAIADVYSNNYNHKNAILYYNKAIKLLRLSKDSISLASVLLNAGDEYYNSASYDSAILLFQESKNIFRKKNYPVGIAYNLGNLGLVYAKLGKNDLAEIKMNEAVKMLTKTGNMYPVAVYQVSLADIYAKRRDLKRALNYAHSALDIGQEEGLKEQIRDASLKLSELYQTQGDYRKAYDYQSQYIAYRDSINNEETIRKMADLRTEYEVSQKQAEVDLKQTEVDLLNEQARNNQIVLWSVIVILVLVLFLVFTLMKVYRVKVRAIRIVRQRRRIIAAQRNQLEEVNRTKDKFFSIISHDIRGPISNFQGVSQLIHLLVESKDYDGLLKLGTMLDTSTKEVSSLLDNLLEWAMSQQGRMPYKPETIKLHELCNSNLSIMENLATAKQITLTEKIKEKVSITADKNSVSTIIRNLVSNAIKFTPEGGSVDLQLTYDLNMAVLIVKDSGIGIPKEKMEHLFDFKGERSRWGTDGEKGVGLGLTLVHEFTELNKGKIEVESEEGKGTTFRVYLPLITE